MKTILKIFALSLLATPVFAYSYQFQYLDQDALRLTMSSLNGNARFVSMGGAFGALGGNLSALSTNPASIGIYRSNEFSFTPALTIGQTETTPGDARSRQPMDLWNFNLGNFGLVSVWDVAKSDNPNEWKMLQFGVGLNRLADFWNRSGYTRFASPWETYLDVLTNEANRTGRPLNPYYSGLAERADLIYFDSVDGAFFNDLMWQDVNGDWQKPIGLTQRQNTRTTGGINEWVFSFGGNYGDMLYLGATIGMPSVNFRQTKTLTEKNEGNANPVFHEWRIRENLEVSGLGINLKLGAIYRPADFVRLGLAIHTPTRYALKEKFSTEISGNTAFISNPGRVHTERGAWDYNIRTPMRLIGSVGFVIARQLLIGAEYEYVNYDRMRISDIDDSFEADNDFIADNYRAGGTIRVGGEYRMDQVSLRLGYNYTMVPYADNLNRNFSGHSLSAGLGFITGSTTIDLAYVNTIRKFRMSPYPQMPNDFYNHYSVTGHQFLVTFGWRF
ncbi:MAG: hypothetical protein FWE63_06545 [Bacteroidales bacterium]|nr:hypothetical protein [Bacteroidales bacterium]